MCIFSYGQEVEKAKFRLFQLENRYPKSDTYKVPANVNSFREFKYLTLKDLFKLYLDNCRELHIKPFQFDRKSPFKRELTKMLNIWMGIYPYPGYKEATNNFFIAIENDLKQNPETLNTFSQLFKQGELYITNLWDFVQYNNAIKEKEIDLNKIAKFIASKDSYAKLYRNNKYLRKEEWSHPAFVFYVLDNFKHSRNNNYVSIVNEIEQTDPMILSKLEIIHAAYEEGFNWLHDASLFFFEDKWFFYEKVQEYLSIKDMLTAFWEPVLGFMPPVKPGIIRWGRPDAFPNKSVPYLEYANLLQPLNKQGENFLKNTSPARICDLLETIREIKLESNSDSIPEGIAIKPLYAFIPSLRKTEIEINKSTHDYDLSCPLTMIISNIPHEIGHFLHFYRKHEWKKEYSKNNVIYYRLIDRYIDEGIAELCQMISIEPILKKYPMLYHDNLLKHYIFGKGNPDNHHTWGLLWMETVYEILGRDFNKLFFLVTQPGISLDELLFSPEILTEEILKISSDTTPLVFQRQERRIALPHTIIFPSCIIELEGDRFKLISHDQIRFE
jgi:hypothetical protein